MTRTESWRISLIEALFQDDIARDLVENPDLREEKLKKFMREAFEALPPVVHQLCRENAKQLFDDEKGIVDDLLNYRLVHRDNTAIEMGLPYDWTYDIDHISDGEKAPRFILARIGFAQTLIRARSERGDDAIATCLRNYVIDYFSRYWQSSCELPNKENWLCTSCRGGTWFSPHFGGLFSILYNFSQHEAFGFDDLLLTFNALDHMMRGLIPNLALGSNWRVHEVANLLTQGISYPYMKNSTHWREIGVNALNEEFEIQFHSDGSHEELCVYYGAGVMDTFFHYYALSRQAPELGLNLPDDRMREIFDYYLATTKPSTRAMATIGDAYTPRDDESLSQDSIIRRNDEGHDWSTWITQAAGDLANQDFRSADFVLGNGPAPDWTSRLNRDSRYVFLRDGWENESLYANINCGYYANCHCHFGLLGIEVAALGREFIVDPGVSALDDRDINKNLWKTRGHSTVCIDGKNQQINSPAMISRHFLGDMYDLVVGIYKGGYVDGSPVGDYQGGFAANHFRHLFFVKDSYFILIDAINVAEGHEVETRLQFMPNRMRQLEDGGYVTGYSDANLALLPLDWNGWQHDMYEGHKDPIEGWLPAKDGGYAAAPVYKATCPSQGQTRWHASLLFPFQGKANPPVQLEMLQCDDQAIACRIKTPDYVDHLRFAKSWSSMTYEINGIRSNSPLVHVRESGGQLQQAFSCEGTHLECGQRQIFNAPGTMLAREFDLKGETAAKVSNPRWKT